MEIYPFPKGAQYLSPNLSMTIAIMNHCHHNDDDYDHHNHHHNHRHHKHHHHHNHDEGAHPPSHVLPLPTNCLHMCHAHPRHTGDLNDDDNDDDDDDDDDNDNKIHMCYAHPRHTCE